MARRLLARSWRLYTSRRDGTWVVGGAQSADDLVEADRTDMRHHRKRSSPTDRRALRRGTEQWRGRGGTVLLTGARGTVRRVLELVGLGADGDVRLA